MIEDKIINDLEIGNEYLIMDIDNNIFVNMSNYPMSISRIKIIKKTKNCVLIGFFNENDNSISKEWKLKDSKFKFIEDLKSHVRKNKLKKIDGN